MPRRGRGPEGAYGRPAARIKAKPRRRNILKGLVVAAIAVLLLPALPAAAADDDPVVITMLGDSITAGYGLAEGEAPPAQLQAWLRDKGVQARVVNAGVSGDTTAGGLARLDWVLAEKPDFLIVALGANDALRGIDPASARDNLDAILVGAKDRGIPVLLAGMLAPPNLGADYAAAFNPIYADLAAKYDIALYPFLLDGVAIRPELNQADGIHPNAAGAALLAERMGPAVLEFVRGG
ncbi:arylesterase [Marinibaculum pumilum]|uniref:Arylesterase n=1 Tax=Marinibaculum pumilum TaxID=1766165 RepID=A0ABV7KXM0_9PROT